MDPDVLADLPVGEFLGRVAARTPAPAGGSAAATAAALAAALLELAVAFESPAGQPGPGVEAARGLRARALELAQEDLSSYAPVLEAQRLALEDPSRPRALRAALSAAAAVPLQIAAVAAEIAEQAAAATARAGRHLLGDAVTATVIAEAACRTAVRLAELNVGEMRHDAERDLAGQLAERAAAARNRALAQGLEA